MYFVWRFCSSQFCCKLHDSKCLRLQYSFHNFCYGMALIDVAVTVQDCVFYVSFPKSFLLLVILVDFHGFPKSFQVNYGNTRVDHGRLFLNLHHVPYHYFQRVPELEVHNNCTYMPLQDITKTSCIDSFRMSRLALESIQPPIHWVLYSFPELMRPEHETEHSPSSTVEVKNEWNYTSTPPVCFMARTATRLVFILMPPYVFINSEYSTEISF